MILQGHLAICLLHLLPGSSLFYLQHIIIVSFRHQLLSFRFLIAYYNLGKTDYLVIQHITILCHIYHLALHIRRWRRNIGDGFMKISIKFLSHHIHGFQAFLIQCILQLAIYQFNAFEEILVDAIKRANTITDREKILKAMQTTDLNKIIGFYGKPNFDENGQTHPFMSVLQYQDGKRVVVYRQGE